MVPIADVSEAVSKDPPTTVVPDGSVYVFAREVHYLQRCNVQTR